MRGVVLVDMDNVIADFDRHLRDVWAARHPERAVIGDDERQHHRIVEDHPEGDRADVAALVAEPGFTLSMPLVDGARDALLGMVDAGFLVYVCTSPLSARSPHAAEKLTWVEDNLGWSWRARTIITKDKTLVRGDVLIDDAVTVVGATAPTWRHVVFDRPFNRAAQVPARMTWSTWRDALSREHGRVRAWEARRTVGFLRRRGARGW